MDGVPEFGNLLGKSSLFNSGDGEADHDNDESGGIGDDDDSRGCSFITSKGKVVKLRKKRSQKLLQPIEHQLFGLDASKVAWREDESYGININALLDRIECQSPGYKDVKEPEKDIEKDIEKETEKDIEKETEKKSETESEKKAKTTEADNCGTELWVEKWCPRNFLDLVGNEKTNRRVLRWIRQWSPCVFDEQLPEVYGQRNETEVLDPLLRPTKKILLIHGPPGIGKTSVAHVAAKQAGYSVAEINASDERAGTLVRDKVHNTLFNHTFNERPVCLVADEIDGSIESGFIKILTDLINKDAQATQRRMLGPNMKSRTKKQRKSAKLLLRPIIAICNNLYAPALEKLKPHCEIIAFKRPSDSSLLERLEHICKVEGLKVPVKFLKELMDVAQGDVRNCVTNLQFIASHQKPNQDPKSNPLDSISKDFSQSWFRICNQVFRRDPRRELTAQLREKTRQVELNGNYERIVQGCHSLYPNVKYSDNGIQKPATIADWLFFHDLMFKSLFEHNGELMRYSSVVPLAFFNLFGDVANREDMRIQNSEFELREQQKSNQDILKLVLHRISMEVPAMVPFTSYESLILTILPHVDYMISSDLSKCRDPKLKQSIFDSLIGLLKCFQLDIVEKYFEQVTSKKLLCIEPPIDKVVLLDPQRQRDVLVKRPVTFHLLLAKLEESKARKRHIKQISDNRERNEEIKDKRARTVKSGVNMADFFKTQYRRNDKGESEPNHKSKEGNNDNKVRIWVKYKEGFSDAVRKNVSWNNLWD